MKPKNFNLAMMIIANHHSTKLEVNPVKENGQVDNDFNISLIEACAGLIENLRAEGFALYLKDGKISLADFAV